MEYCTSFKTFLNEDLCALKSSKQLNFYDFFVNINVSWKEYGVQTHGTCFFFFHLPNIKSTKV